DDADGATQTGEREGAHVAPIDLDRSLVDVVEAGQQVDQRALPGSGRADEGHLRASRDANTDVDQSWVGAGVAEADVLEGDGLVDSLWSESPARRCVHQLHRLPQHLLD